MISPRGLWDYHRDHDHDASKPCIRRAVVASVTPSGPPIAFAAMTIGKDMSRIDLVCVHPSRRREGIASWLLSRLADPVAAVIRRSAVFARVRESSLASHLSLRNAGFRCVGICKGAFSGPVEDAYAFLKWNGSKEKAPRSTELRVLEYAKRG